MHTIHGKRRVPLPITAGATAQALQLIGLQPRRRADSEELTQTLQGKGRGGLPTLGVHLETSMNGRAHTHTPACWPKSGGRCQCRARISMPGVTTAGLCGAADSMIRCCCCRCCDCRLAQITTTTARFDKPSRSLQGVKHDGFKVHQPDTEAAAAG